MVVVFVIGIEAPHILWRETLTMDHHRATPQFEAKITRPDNQPALVDLTFRPTKSMSREELHKMIMDLLQVSWRMDERTDPPR